MKEDWAEKLERLHRAGWHVDWSGSPTAVGWSVFRVTAQRDLPGGHIQIEMEAGSAKVAVDELLRLCDGVVVTE